ncbi:RAVE subunit 2/Rogdi [Tricladium varicosporioides]|nr:RAVE subunit 2/Rogdi [Hymenoscyphus varicosporioides]
MATTVFPYLPTDEVKKAEAESTARELSWLLDSLQETLISLKSGLEECYALLAPIEPGSTLVMSSPRSESVKGHITRVGTRVVKGTLHLRLKTHPHLHLSLSPSHPLILPHLSHLRTLINQSLDCVDITRWTGDRHSAPFISSQLHLLHQILLEALSLLKGPSLLTPSNPSSTSSATPELPPNSIPPWNETIPNPETFTPTLPSTLSLHLQPTSSSLLLTIRVLEPTAVPPSTFNKFALAIGAQRRLEHDEMDDVFMYKGEEVRVREKVRVESSADPTLLVLGAKLGALERAVQAGRVGLGVVLGQNPDGEEEG